jgi:ABC-type nitrate/sulfonate/bicarbonate transport system substrate-binding protein
MKGKSIAVSSLNSGPAVLSRKLMSANGIAANDFDLIPVGGTAERFTAIRSGAVTGGLLLQPEDLRLMSEGFNRLALTTDYIPHYQWLTIPVMRNWARDNEDKLVRGLRALNDAYKWVYDKNNRDEAIALMVDTTKAPIEQATATYDLYVDSLRIWPVDGRFEDAAMQSVLELMGELGQLPTPLPAPSKYTDLTYIEKANRP